MAWIEWPWNLVLVFAMTLVSILFSGLGTCLMSIDTNQLQVLIDARTQDDAALQSASYARRILPLRQSANTVLCTLIFGGTAANALTAVLLADLVGSVHGWLVASLLIFMLCELLPQAVCTHNGLWLGAETAPVLRLLVLLLFPLTKPVAMILDFLLPRRENVLDRSQFRPLVEYQHFSNKVALQSAQAEILVGALNFTQRTVDEVMVRLDDAFKLYMDEALDFELLSKVVSSGFSRLPVMTVEGDGEHVEGVLHCKDLLSSRFSAPAHGHHRARQRAFSDESNGTEATAVGSRGSPVRFGRSGSDGHEAWETVGDLVLSQRNARQEQKVYVCGRKTRLLTLLREFKRSRHLAVVADIDDPGEAVLDRRTGLPVRHVGIVTLQDVFEMILQAKVSFREKAVPRVADHGLLCLEALKKANNSGNESQDQQQQLRESEVEAIADLLVEISRAFSAKRLSRERLLELIRDAPIERPGGEKTLYRYGERATHATLVLQGVVRIITGDDGFESTEGPWALLGMRLLEATEQDGESDGNAHSSPRLAAVVPGRDRSEKALAAKADSDSFVTDFSASVVTGGRCLVVRLERARYLTACRRTANPEVVVVGGGGVGGAGAGIS